jgi:hypothetical protein
MTEAIIMFAWLAFGLTGFVLWHTRSQDFTAEHIGVAAIMALIAPLPWMFLVTEVLADRVLVKRRSRTP